MLVTEGTGKFTIEGQKTAVGPGSMACAPAIANTAWSTRAKRR